MRPQMSAAIATVNFASAVNDEHDLEEGQIILPNMYSGRHIVGHANKTGGRTTHNQHEADSELSASSLDSQAQAVIDMRLPSDSEDEEEEGLVPLHTIRAGITTTGPAATIVSKTTQINPLDQLRTPAHDRDANMQANQAQLILQTKEHQNRLTELWSLPLPTRRRTVSHSSITFPQEDANTASTASTPVAASSSSSTSSTSVDSSSRAALRSHLLSLHLPESHIRAVLFERDALLTSPLTSVVTRTMQQPLEHWIDQVMDKMYAEEKEKNGESVATEKRKSVSARHHKLPSIPPATVTPAILDAPPHTNSNGPTCGICWDPINPVSDVESGASSAPPTSTTAPSCTHLFCTSCWNGYLSSKVLNNQVLFLRCPSVTPVPCKRMLEEEEILQRIRSEEMRMKYKELHATALLARDPSVRWCTRPSCSRLLTGGSESSPKMTCNECGTNVCFLCGATWHPKISCAEASKRALEEFMEEAGGGSNGNGGSSTSSAPLDLKSCPSCLEGIERLAGCNYLRCPRCEYEFCWICLEEYTDYHYKWWNLRGCPMQHMKEMEWAGSDVCCCTSCCCLIKAKWIGTVKRALVRILLFFVYFLTFLLFLPFLLLFSPILLYRYHKQGPERVRKKQLKERKKVMQENQLKRARGLVGVQDETKQEAENASVVIDVPQIEPTKA